MKIRDILKIIPLFVAVVLLAACGGGESSDAAEGGEHGADGSGDAAHAESDHSHDGETESADSPRALAEKALALHTAAMEETIEAMSGDPQPTPAVVIEAVTAIRDTYAAQLIEIGKIREEKGEEFKRKFNTAYQRLLMGQDQQDVFTRFTELQSNYAAHPDAGPITSAISIISQYTDFALLTQQAPEEAEKYGVSVDSQ